MERPDEANGLSKGGPDISPRISLGAIDRAQEGRLENILGDNYGLNGNPPNRSTPI